MAYGSSLGRRLLLAFLVIAGLPALTGLWGWVKLADVARNQDGLINRTLPAIIDVRGFTEVSSRVAAMAPEFAAVTREPDRARRAAFLLGQVDTLHQRLERHRQHDNSPPYGLSRTLMDMRNNIGVLDVLVQRRIMALNDRRRQHEAGLAATAELLDIADTLVANAEMGTSAVITNLYDFGTEPASRQERFEALDKLLEVDLFQLGLMFELRAHTAEIGLTLSRMAAAESAEVLQSARQDLERRSNIIARRIRSVQDPVRAQHALRLLNLIAPVSDAGNDLYAVSARVLEMNARIASVEAAVRVAATQMDREAEALANEIHASAVVSGAEGSATIRFARQLTTLGVVAALVISLAVLWFYVRGNITRRLDALSVTMARLAGGDTQEPVLPTGKDEIARMESAVEIFRQQAIENRQLEQERTRHLEELSQHRNQLQQLVDDQTEQLRGEVAAHAEARSRAEAADHAKSEFLAMMSHELRTPMNGVLGMLRSLEGDDLTERQRSCLRAAQTSGNGLMAILNDILFFPLSESGRIVNTVTTFSLAGLIQDIGFLMSPIAHEKGLAFRLDLPDDLPPAVQGDMAKLRQILFNLVGNALKFTAIGEVVLRVEAGSMQDGEYPFTISVQDTGRGISEQARERIFEVFEQESPATARQYGGTGLGLAICRGFATVLGADLSVESTPGIGSVFTLAISFRPGRVEDLPGSGIDDLGPVRPLSVLIVEDHAINRMVVESYLEHAGHNWQIAETGEAAVAKVAAGNFDVVLMDVNLPGLSGTEATRQIRNLPDRQQASVPIIGISAHVQETHVAENLNAGMSVVLAKPLTPERLSSALSTLPSRPEARNPLRSMLADIGAERGLAIGRIFMQQMQTDLAEITQAHASHDFQATHRTAHRMKGAAGNLDLASLVSCLRSLEVAADRQDRAACCRDISRLEKIAAVAREDLAAALAVIEESGVIPASQ